MDRITANKQACRQLVQSFADYWRPNDGTETKAIADDQAGCYRVVNSGVLRGRFVDFNFMHLEVDDVGRVHIVRNDTEWEIDEELQSLGVAPCDIRIARHEPATV